MIDLGRVRCWPFCDLRNLSNYVQITLPFHYSNSLRNALIISKLCRVFCTWISRTGSIWTFVWPLQLFKLGHSQLTLLPQKLYGMFASFQSSSEMFSTSLYQTMFSTSLYQMMFSTSLYASWRRTPNLTPKWSEITWRVHFDFSVTLQPFNLGHNELNLSPP